MEQIEETKYALEALLAEFGETLPSGFVERMLRIGKTYIYGAVVGGIYYSGRSYIYDQFETIIYHSGHGSSVEEIKNEMEWFINNIDRLSEMMHIKDESW